MSKLLYTDLFELATDGAAQSAYVSSDTALIPTPIIEQTVGGSHRELGDIAGVEYRVAQSFTLSETTIIGQIEVYFGTTINSPSGNITLRIETDTAGSPSGTLADVNATKAIASITPSDWNTWLFSTYPTLTADTYWIVLSCDNQATDQRWRPQYNSDGTGYTGGTLSLSTDGGSTWSSVDDDLTFKVYDDTVVLQSYSESTIKQQGSYSLKGIAVITDSLNDTLTKTLTDYLDYSIMDKIIFQVRSSRTGTNLQLQIHDTGGTTSTHDINIISADTWQTETWDISGITTTNRDTIDKIIIKVINADAENTFYFDSLYSEIDIPMRVKLDYMEYATDETAQVAYVTSDAATEVDYMEYATDVAAQSAYVTDGGDSPVVSQTTDNTTGEIGDENNNEFEPAQSFTLSADTFITSVSYKLAASTGTPSGNHTITIETVAVGGEPSGTLAHANATKVITPTASAVNTATFATPFILGAGTYFIHINCDDQTTNNRWGIRSTSLNPYAGGSSWRSINASWSIQTGYDLYFVVNTSTLQSFSEGTIKTQGTYSLKGIASITDSLNDTLTKSGLTIDLTGKGVIKFDTYASRTGTNLQMQMHDSGGTTSTKDIVITDANTWETTTWDISGIANADKDAIDSIIIKVINADAENMFYFDNFIVPEGLQSYSESTIKQQGSYSLKGIALITESLNDTLTRTVNPTIDLSTVSKVIFQVRASRTGHNFDLKLRDDSETWHTKEVTIVSANTWETVIWDLTNIVGTERDAIDRIQIKITNADAENIIYVDNVYGTVVSESVSVWAG